MAGGSDALLILQQAGCCRPSAGLSALCFSWLNERNLQAQSVAPLPLEERRISISSFAQTAFAQSESTPVLSVFVTQ
jgi:hypothetical protein